MENKTSITVWKMNMGTYYYVERDVTDMFVCELETVIKMMDKELDEKIKIANSRKPKLPK